MGDLGGSDGLFSLIALILLACCFFYSTDSPGREFLFLGVFARLASKKLLLFVTIAIRLVNVSQFLESF